MKKQKILVLGMGKSGLAVANLLSRSGADVDLYDEIKRGEADLNQLSVKQKNLNLFFSDDSFNVEATKYNFCVISPGISLDRPIVRQIQSQGIELLGEMELSTRYFPGNYVAVTGTNGKSTTTTLVDHILKGAKKDSLMAGNIGDPLSLLVDQAKEDTIGVFEVSSYQLETVRQFHPVVAAITNITEDHLARHKTMEKYIKLKKRIYLNQTDSDYTVLNYDDSELRMMAGETKAKVLFFSTKQHVEGAYLEEEVLWLRRGNHVASIMPRSELKLPGKHNVENALCAICICHALGLNTMEIAEGIRSFKGVEHRQEEVCSIDGVRYINDSKATNSDSAMMALNSYNSKVFILLGGSPKKADYSQLAKTIVSRDVEAILFGQTKDEIAEALEKAGMSRYYKVNEMLEAVLLARKKAKRGDIVLLSPACPSFDFFRNFEHRGEAFKEIVHGIEKGSIQ